MYKYTISTIYCSSMLTWNWISPCENVYHRKASHFNIVSLVKIVATVAWKRWYYQSGSYFRRIRHGARHQKRGLTRRRKPAGLKITAWLNWWEMECFWLSLPHIRLKIAFPFVEMFSFVDFISYLWKKSYIGRRHLPAHHEQLSINLRFYKSVKCKQQSTWLNSWIHKRNSGHLLYEPYRSFRHCNRLAVLKKKWGLFIL